MLAAKYIYIVKVAARISGRAVLRKRIGVQGWLKRVKTSIASKSKLAMSFGSSPRLPESTPQRDPNGLTT